MLAAFYQSNEEVLFLSGSGDEVEEVRLLLTDQMSQQKEESSAVCFFFCTVRCTWGALSYRFWNIGSGVILEKVRGKGEEYS